MKLLPIILLSAVALASSAHAGLIVVGNLARTATIHPGESFEGVIFLKNTDTQPAEARVSQTDYMSFADGRNEYGEPASSPRSNAGWITVTPTRVKIGPGETVPVRYKGAAPADPSLRGTFWSMIMIEPQKAPAITPEGKVDQVTMGLQTTIRFAVQIVTEIGRDGERSLQVADKRLLREAGQRALQLDIANDGERLLIPMISIELFDSQGASAGRFDAGRTRIYPGCSVRAKIDLSNIPSGNYATMVLLDSGDAEVMGAQYDLAILP